MAGVFQLAEGITATFGQVIVLNRLTFLPRVLGVLLMISGLGWMIYLAPPLAKNSFPFIAAASALGEIPLQLWFIVMGVNAQRWREQAGTASGQGALSA